VPGTPLEHARLRYRFCVYGFVVMLEHVHLLVSEPDKGLVVNAMQSLKISSALRTARFREFQGRRSPLWQKRSHDRNIRDYAEFVEQLCYRHRNPVKRGRCACPEDWPSTPARARAARAGGPA
jgi:putative transposase